MLQFVVRRFFILIPMLFILSIVAFAIIQAPPGDYLTSYIDRLLASGDYVDQAEALLDAQEALTPGVEAHVSGLRGAALMAGGESGELHLDRARRLDPRGWGDGHLDAAELR